MTEYPSYVKYKPSPVGWIDAIPSHWHDWKVTHGFKRIGSGTTPKSDDPTFYGGDIPWVTTSELRESVIYDTAQHVTEDAVALHSALKVYPAGSLAIAMYGATIGRLGVLGVDAAFNQACCVFAEPTVFHSKFVYYWLWMRRPILISLSSGGGQPNLSQDDLKKLIIPIPGILEQQAITRFLDFKTAQIDALIAKRLALLEKLAEKRTSMINRAVTKGLDLSVPTKDSGASWLGRIPSHWNAKRLRFLTTMSGGMTPSTSNPAFWDGDIPWITPKDMKREVLVASEDTLTEEALKETGITLYDAGKVLIVVRGMILAHTFPVAINAVNSTVNQDMKAISTVMNSEYLALLLRGIQPLILSIVEEAAHGTKVLRTDVFKNLMLPVPPLSEQALIVSRVSELTNALDSQAKTIQTLIDRLHEFRSAVITNAVTGRIDIRDVPIPLTDDLPMSELEA